MMGIWGWWRWRRVLDYRPLCREALFRSIDTRKFEVIVVLCGGIF